MSLKLNPAQLTAIDHAVRRRVSIVNGGAGTGKTTVIEKIAASVNMPLLVCPTGKAAARLREATGMPSSTIHSALKYNGEDFMLKSLAGYSVIIDEASMVDSELMAAICQRRPDRLVLVGDEAQLMPVGNGAPFHDLIRLRPELVTTLDTCYRNTEAIFKAAAAIRAGNIPARVDTSAGEHWEMTRTGTPEETQAAIIGKVMAGEIDFEADIVLVCRNGERDMPAAGTVHGINQAAIAALGFDPGAGRWQPKQRIICGKNFPKLDTWNGTTGTITGVASNSVWVRGDIPFMVGEAADGDGSVTEIEWPAEVLRSCQHAYALTVHKSQGSQYNRVYFAAFPQDIHCLLSRSLIYTAVTRARKHCQSMGDPRALAAGIAIQPEKKTVLQQIAGAAA